MTCSLSASVNDDYTWMAKAIRLARKGRFTTSPNPRVGCIVLDAKGELAGQGFHVQAGTPHAEVHALREAGEKARGGTAYVTLEPCSHFGRTPPCANALIDAGVSRVVVAMTDPNPQVSGNGIRRLQDAGIEVITDVLAAESAALNPGFIKRMITGKPRVTVKMGISLDGKIALSNGVSQWITGSEARRDVQLQRAQSCAVLTGSGTALADNPSLLVRKAEADLSDYPALPLPQPLRVVIDSHNALPGNLQLFTDGHKTLRITGQPVAPETDVPAQAISMKGDHIDLHELMMKLGERQLNDVWVEAGPGLGGALLAAGEVDQLVVYQAPKILGDKGKSMMTLQDFTALEQTPTLSLTDVRQIGPDIRLTYDIIS